MGETLYLVIAITALIFVGPYFGVKAENSTKIECGTVKGVAQFCGEGAFCIPGRVRSICVCERGHSGDPLVQCVKRSNVECFESSQCSVNQACVQEKCIDPCLGTCGENAACRVTNHSPICSCPSGYSGDPFISCSRVDSGNVTCEPSSCGNNTRCQIVDNKVLCSCLSGYQGNPLQVCLKVCKSNSECAASTPSCEKGICRNPCENACGVNAKCILIDLAPVCSCPEGTTGDPFIRCLGLENPCEPTPCGANSACRVIKNQPDCSCLTGYEGDPLVHCNKYLCNSDSDCGENAICIDNKSLRVHKNCKCREGYYGDPFEVCFKGQTCSQHSDCPSSKPTCKESTCTDACNNVCGANAVCDYKEGSLPVCICPDGWAGNPFIKCLPFQLGNL